MLMRLASGFGLLVHLDTAERDGYTEAIVTVSYDAD